MKNPIYEQIQSEGSEGQAAHSAACAAGQPERQSDVPLFWGVKKTL
jgi:hypothetical protein